MSQRFKNVIVVPYCMDILLDDLIIQAPLNPTRQDNLNDRDWEGYRVEGFINGVYVGHITITRGLNCAGRYNDRFFLELSRNPPVPKPYVSYQETQEEFRGRGICGKLIILANEFYRGKLGTTLYSDTHFVISFEKQSKRVWQKLQEKNIAVFEPYLLESGELQDRWFIS